MIKKKIKINLEKPIVFYPQLARALGGIEEALFVQQLYYWTDKSKNKDGWVYKTKKQWEEETCLSRKKQDRIRKKLEEMGIIEIKRKKANGAPTLWYKLNVDKVNELLGANGKVQKGPMEKPQRDSSISPNGTLPYTEITTENTTENNNFTIVKLSSDQSDDISNSSSNFSETIKKIRKYFERHFTEEFNRKPIWEFGKEEKLVKRFLKLYTVEEAFDLIDAFFASDKLNDYPSLAAVFSTHTINLWASGNLIADYWKYKQFKQKRSQKEVKD